ncbi:MAG TPA: toll/interleukin-1 receptor domain-containing protein [Jatrophihabitans sp.]|jgi:hypothetical protein
MARLFISYARQDLTIVRSLVGDLGELGHEPFFDQNLTGGQRWWDVLLDHIQNSEGFLPVLSTAYRESEACHREAEWADRLGIPVLPIDLGQIGPELCDPHIAEANWIRYGMDDRASVMRLARALNALPAVTLPAPVPDRPPIPISYLSAVEQEIQRAPALPFERQLVILSTLRDRLGTNEDRAARILLTDMRRRPDVTYSNAVEIDRMLATPPPEHVRRQPQPPVPPFRQPNAGPQPPQPQPRQPQPPQPQGAPTQVLPPPGGTQSTPSRRRSWIIAAIVAAVVVATGIVAIIAATGGSDHHPLAAPQHVAVTSSGTDLDVSWDAVPGANSYRVTDSQGQSGPVTVHTTNYTLRNAIYRNHRLVVVALDSGGSAGAGSAASSWAARPRPAVLAAPSGVSVTSSGYDLRVTWTAVTHATGYRIADGTAEVSETGTSHVFPNGIYSNHRYVVTAVDGTSTSRASTPATWTAKTKLSPDEQRLAYRVPSTTADPGSCEGYPAGEKEANVVAEVRCTAASVSSQATMTALFAKQIRPRALTAYEHSHYNATFKEPKNGSCRSAGHNGARTNWSFGTGNPTVGDLFCYYGDNKQTVLAWTYDSDSVVLQVQATLPVRLDKVYTWWTKAAAQLRPAP